MFILDTLLGYVCYRMVRDDYRTWKHHREERAQERRTRARLRPLGVSRVPRVPDDYSAFNGPNANWRYLP